MTSSLFSSSESETKNFLEIENDSVCVEGFQ
jgi:hypothetical protein